MTGPSLDVLRARAKDAVVQSSLRAVALQIGLSHRGLSLFLDGGTPYPRTVVKLRDWYVRDAAVRRQPTPETTGAAVALLLELLPEGEREGAAGELLDVVAELYKRRKVKRPEWIDALRAKTEG